MQYHPPETIILQHTMIVRNRMLPPNAYGHVTVNVGDSVIGNKVVAEGELPQDYRIIDIAGALGIDPNNTEVLNEVIELFPGDTVEIDQPLAKARRRRDRKRIPLAPSNGVVSFIERGRMILQINPEPIRIHARVPGEVIERLGMDGNRGVRIESRGTLIQCAWGNDRFAFAPFASEPEEGLQSLLYRDSLLESFRGQVYILNRPIEADDFKVVVQQQLGGIVAPSMPYYLRETAMMIKVPIILTNGFGDRQPTPRIFDMLREMESNREGAFDATMPKRWHHGRPEIVLPTATSQLPTIPASDVPLSVGMMVRLRRAPFDGQIGVVESLPNTPQRIENNLPVAAAYIKLLNGKHVTVPLANVELLGESSR